MQAQIITNIGQLVSAGEHRSLLRGNDLSVLPCIKNAWLLIEDGIIAGFGPMENIPESILANKDKINADGAFVLPCWCDSHTHLVFAASRENEFLDKLKGL